MSPATLDPDTIALLDRTAEVDARTPRKDGSESSRPIWVVVVDGVPYVRSYRGPSGAWYRHALRDAHLTLAAGGREIPLAAHPDHDAAVNQRIDAAFEAKYGERSPGPTAAMLAPDIVATTLRLDPE